MKKDATQAAKEIRKVLKATYPGVKFSVRSKRYAGGSSIDVSWTDGPTQNEVSKMVEHLKGYANGYYNEYIITDRSISREVMEAAARAVAEYYEVEMPEILMSGTHPYVEDYTMVGFSQNDHGALCDKIHRAAHATSIYSMDDLAQAFIGAYPN